MKQLFLLFLLFFTTDSFASGIASNTNSAPCTNTTLETYSGNSNLAADWQPNEIQLRWYSMNTQITPTNTTANTCVYDGSLAIPQNAPTRTGYTFAGWTVRPEIDFATTIPTNAYGEDGWALVDGYCLHYYTNPSETLLYNAECGSNVDDLGQREWKTKYNHGTLYGMSGCSTTRGTYLQSGHPTIGSGQNCWCKATGYKPANSDIISASLFTLDWVFISEKTSEGVCSQDCPIRCSIYAYWVLDFCTALFTPAQ